MGLLDGGLTSVVGGAFSWILLDATVHRRTLTDNGKGGMTETETLIEAKGMIDTATKAMREADGFNDSDVALLLLAQGGVQELRLDDEVTIRGSRYHVLPPVALDAAMTHWTARGRLKR